MYSYHRVRAPRRSNASRLFNERFSSRSSSYRCSIRFSWLYSDLHKCTRTIWSFPFTSCWLGHHFGSILLLLLPSGFGVTDSFLLFKRWKSKEAQIGRKSFILGLLRLVVLVYDVFDASLFDRFGRWRLFGNCLFLL